MSILRHGPHSPRQPSSRRMGRRRVLEAAMMRTCSHHLLATVPVSCNKPVLVTVAGAGLCSADYPAAAHLTTVCATPVQAAECCVVPPPGCEEPVVSIRRQL